MSDVDPRGPDSREYVQSFARGLTVIRAFDADHPRLTLSEVAARAEVTRAAARRFLITLEHLGYVRSGRRRFELTPRVLELGFSYLSALSLPEVVQPHLERLSREVGESVSAAVLDGDDIVYVARVPVRRILSVGIQIGTRFPARDTSMGRVLLAALAERPADPEFAAELDQIADQGWAIVEAGLEPGLRSVAAPVHGRDGRVVAAVNIPTSASLVPLERLRAEHLPALLRTTAAIDAELRHL
ncbi:IclR family transcriptional regulator [Microbacterium paludicola]|uniref:IclR family transcriptional regulator n=1 Tax=Microbacterium paludicola TaxID=300019 RepID=A0A4Y9FVL4_9MICO|nr:IclR family transcriptional regulator C-terminal domain-containing protein [Microbacterium paludicola]MBF0816705.1 helix-turn-helix domain-containing protein [Microbacterium paludicola]TFU32584.1 IclR family transcriptional regulator [Microbacterium paludicola]